MKNKYLRLFVFGVPISCMFGSLLVFAGCHNKKEVTTSKTQLHFRGASKEHEPAYIPSKGFTYTPLEYYGKRNRIAVFDYTKLYDSAAIQLFESVDDAYYAHLIQYEKEHTGLRLIGTEPRFSPDGVVIGHATYWEIPFEVTIPQNPKRSASAASEDIMINEKMIPPPVKVPNLLKIQPPRPKKSKI